MRTIVPMSSGKALGHQFAVQPNGLTFLRLCLTLEVLVWHAYALQGDTFLPDRLERFVAELAADSFFALSGFLVCRSWSARPDVGTFVRARARRLLPGLWTCLLLTAFVIAPVAAWCAGSAGPTLHGRWQYVVGNADTWATTWGIDGGPVGVPWPGAWNGSLWSIGYEVAAYLVVLALGAVGLLRPFLVTGVTATCWSCCVLVDAAGGGHTATAWWLGPHSGLLFACGALLWVNRDRVPVTGSLGALAAVLVLVGALTPDPAFVAAPGLAYLCLTGGLWLGRFPRLVLRMDLSYGAYLYGFPVQQGLLVAGVSLGWLGFSALSVVVVLPLAALSWRFVERPAFGWPRPGTDVPGRAVAPSVVPVTTVTGAAA